MKYFSISGEFAIGKEWNPGYFIITPDQSSIIPFVEIELGMGDNLHVLYIGAEELLEIAKEIVEVLSDEYQNS